MGSTVRAASRREDSPLNPGAGNNRARLVGLMAEEAGMRLAEKIAIITGAARGIGRAVALGFAREGASVVIADLRTELAERTVGEIASAGGQALAVEADVANLADQDRLVATTVERFGRIDILHNNAGVSGRPGDFFAYT